MMESTRRSSCSSCLSSSSERLSLSSLSPAKLPPSSLISPSSNPASEEAEERGWEEEAREEEVVVNCSVAVYMLGLLNILFIIACCSFSLMLFCLSTILSLSMAAISSLSTTTAESSSLLPTWPAGTTLLLGVASRCSPLIFVVTPSFFPSCTEALSLFRGLNCFLSLFMISLIFFTFFLLYPPAFFLSILFLTSFICIITSFVSTILSPPIMPLSLFCS